MLDTKNTPYAVFVMILLGVVFSLDSDVLLSDSHVVLVNILSSPTMEVDDAKVRVYTYDGGMVGTTTIDVDENEYGSSVILIDTPSEGYYEPVRVVLQNDELREVKHVWTWIG